MQQRPLGQTGLYVSTLGFGCGSIGGLLVRGEYPAMRQAVARALELGVTYFDTASMYGNGQSEVNLGAILRELGPDAQAQAIIGTKVRLFAEDLGDIAAAVIASVHASLRRMGQERVDLIQFHNRLGSERNPAHSQVALDDLVTVVDAFETLRQQGKVGFWGITGLGETAVLHQAITQMSCQSIQACYNLLNPSAGAPVPANFPFQDHAQLIDHAGAHGAGVICIRVLAGGALSGTTERHPVAAQSVNPIASEAEYADDVGKAQLFQFLVEEGHVINLVEAAIRFVISHPAVSTALVGVSSLAQLEQAITYANRGPLPQELLEQLPPIWARFG